MAQLKVLNAPLVLDSNMCIVSDVLYNRVFPTGIAFENSNIYPQWQRARAGEDCFVIASCVSVSRAVSTTPR